MLTVASLIVALFVSIVLGTAVAILAWRQRPEPGATPLVALLVGQTWWSTCIVFRLRATGVESKLFWIDLAWIGVVVIPVAWLLLALEYTGRDRYTRPRHVALLSIIPVITVILALVEPRTPMLTVHVRDSTAGVVRIQQGGSWFWVIAAYTYLLGFLGLLPLVDAVTSDSVTFREQGVVLAVGLLVPWVTNVLHLAGVVPTAGIDQTPIAFSVSGVAYLYAITRVRFLKISPAPNRRARRLVFDHMREGVVVVDTNGNVVDVNDNCLDILDIDAHETLGRPASEVIPEYNRLSVGIDGESVTVTDESNGRAYDATVTPITDVRNQTLGRVIAFHDVSRYLRQQQRLEVLNRLFRHNIRTETNIIHGYAEQVTDDSAGLIQDRASRIAEIGRKGREAIKLFEADSRDRSPMSLRTLLRGTVESVRETHPDVTVEFDPPDRDAKVAGLLTHVFRNAIENAAKHNDAAEPRVWVASEVADDRAHVEITDNGPGISEYELEVIGSGTETALKHGSGIGLWIIRWGTDIVGGRVEFVEHQPRGCVVTIDIPVLSHPEPDRT